MYDTYVTIVGNVLNPPEWRRTTNTGALVTTFKIASTARRLDRESGKWVDGNSLRVRVSCWRALAGNVFASVTVGDPLIVTGRLYTRDWVDEAGNRRVGYELEATAVGHDLSRGRSRFERVRPQTSTSAVEDDAAPHRLGGEPTESVPDDEAPAQFEDAPFDPSDPVDGPPFAVAAPTTAPPG
jgi:single-strand DNA-binding protein